MFEITYNDRDVLNRYIDEHKAYPGARYDFTFENRFLVYHCEITKELHYIVLDMETGYGSELCRRKKGCPIREESFKALIPHIFQSIKYTGSKRHMDPMDADPIAVIDSVFRVVLPNYGYAIREEQIRLAKQMYRGLTHDLVSINEAEVGTGKTLAFLVAALVARKLNSDGPSKPVTITTSNIELQTALVEREIPKLSRCLMDYRIIDKPLNAVLRKGKEHYFCKQRFEDFMTSIKRTPEKYGKLIDAFERSNFERQAFDLDRIKMRPSLKERICVKIPCKGCKYAKECRYLWYVSMAKEAEGIDFQVTNHNLYLTSQRLRSEMEMPGGMLLSSDYVIVDEAHKLKEAAIEVFGNRLCEKDVPAFVKSVSVHCKTSGSHAFYHEMLNRLLTLNAELFAGLRNEYCRDDHDDDQSTLMIISQECGTVIESMRQLVVAIEAKCKLDNPGRLLKGCLKAFRRTNNLNVWTEADENGVLSLCCSPKNIGAVLHDRVWNKDCSHVLTSGTMSDGTDFSFFMKENGIDRLTSRLVSASSAQSPFDYANHTRLYIPQGMPYPDMDNPEYIHAIAEQVVKLVYATNGHTAVLFTSYKVLNAVYEQTKDRLSAFDLFCMTRSNRTAIQDFKKSRNGVLFASGSMWEGVDCIGDTLSSVIIVKLPFPRRSAVMEQKKAESENVRDFIRRYAVPEMLIKLRQGVGRLIRSEDDTGLVSVLDSRAATGEHGTRVAKVLQKYPSVSSIDEIKAFMRAVKPKEYFSEV